MCGSGCSIVDYSSRRLGEPDRQIGCCSCQSLGGRGTQASWRDFHRDCTRLEGIRDRVNRRAKPGWRLTDHQKRINPLARVPAPGRTCLPGDQAFVGIYNSPLPGDRQESGPRAYPLCVWESLHAAPSLGAATGKVRLDILSQVVLSPITEPKILRKISLLGPSPKTRPVA